MCLKFRYADLEKSKQVNAFHEYYQVGTKYLFKPLDFRAQMFFCCKHRDSIGQIFFRFVFVSVLV